MSLLSGMRLYFYFMCMEVLSICKYEYDVCVVTKEARRRVLDFLELQLQEIVSYHVGTVITRRKAATAYAIVTSFSFLKNHQH